jgi:branched-subunit amino acid aminotransferase/4-amino-4-deoxychorismate lyase
LRALLASLKADARFRVTVFKDEGLDFFITASPLKGGPNPLKLGKAVKIKVQGLIPDFLKLGNYAETILELKHASSKGFDDVFFLDNKNCVTECSTSNIFVIKGERISTPFLNGLFLNGIIRQKVIQMLLEKKIGVQEKSLSYNEFLESDEIFLTNSVRGIISVKSVDNGKILETTNTNKIAHFFEKFLESYEEIEMSQM